MVPQTTCTAAMLLWRMRVIAVLLICIPATYSSKLNDFNSHVIRKRDLTLPKAGTEGPYLPRDVTPIGYHIWLQPVPQDRYFKGQVEVNISCLSPTNNIVLHAGVNINITNAGLSVIEPEHTFQKDRQINKVYIERVTRSSPEDWLQVTLSRELQKGVTYKLLLMFTSNLSNESSNTGIYYGNYDKEKFGDRWYVAANMGENNARKVFPCFDEFPYKAPFTISIGHPEMMRSLSNMPFYETKPMVEQDNWMWDHFETSPPMSPFSVNIFIFDLEVIVPVSPRFDLGSTVLHMYGPAYLHYDFQDAGNKILQMVETIETYLCAKYPLPHLQIVVSPGIRSQYDGFGLLIFSDRGREVGSWPFWPLNILFGMADQWLIHLTTPHSWSDVTFGNGITQYVSAIGYYEALKDTKNAQIFDWANYYSMSTNFLSSVNYSKQDEYILGFWLLRMLNCTLTENTLRSGLNSFLYDRAYKTFVLDNFLEAVSEQARRDIILPSEVTVQEIVGSWLQFTHFPLVAVSRNYKTRTARIEQKVFVLKKSTTLPEKVKNHQWYVPLMLLQHNQTQERPRNVVTWMKGEQTVVLEDMPPSNVFILINAEITGLFVVNYDLANWELLTKHLITKQSSPILSASTRSKLLTDSFLLASAEELPFSVPLNISLMLRDETDFAPWFTFHTLFRNLKYMLQKTRLITFFHEYVWKITSDLYEQYGGYSGKAELNDDTNLQGIVEMIMCELGAEDCIAAMSAKYSPGKCNCHVLLWGSHEIWNKSLFWGLGYNEDGKLDKNYLTMLASCTQHKERMNTLLEAVLFKYAISDEDVLDTIDNVKNPYLLLRYVSDNWSEIKKKYEHKQKILESLVYKTTSKFTTSDGYDLVNEFYMARKHDSPNVLRAISTALEKVAENSKWYDHSLPQIESWIRHYLTEK